MATIVFIATIPGRGYKFVAEVRSSGESSEVIRPGGQDSNRAAAAPRRTSRIWPFALAAFILAGVVLMGMFRWNTVPEDGPIRSVAILPFKPITAENRDEALELGMADTLISKLSGTEGLRVRPVAAVRRFASPEQDPVDAGRQLGVEAVLEGGVQISGGRVRVSTTLLRVADGNQIWAGQFEEQLSDIFAVQDSISERVASALKVRLRNQSLKSYTGNVEAYQFFLKGKLHSYRLVLPEVQQGISYYEQAIAADPSFAVAYVELAYAYRALVLTNDAPANEIMPKSKAAAMKAIQLDGSLAEAWAALAFSEFWYDWDWRSSEEHFKKAIELNPDSVQSHAFYAHLLSNLGRHDEALAEIQRARQIDPLDLVSNSLEGQILFFAGRKDESTTTLRSIALSNPNFWLVHLFIARNFTDKAMWPEAIAAATKAREITGGNAETAAVLAFALARSGDQAGAQKILTELEARARSGYIPSYALAMAHLPMGDRTRTLELLEEAFGRREPLMVFLKVEPKWDELRGEPRFAHLVERMNFDQ